MTNDITLELAQLFAELFDPPGLRRFLFAGPQGREVAAELPGSVTGLAELSFEASLVLRMRGLINDELFKRLCLERRGRVDLIVSVWLKINPNPKPPPLPPEPPQPWAGPAPDVLSVPPVHRLKIAIGQGRWQSEQTWLGTAFHCSYELYPAGLSGVGSFKCPWDERKLRSIRERLRDTSKRPGSEELLAWGGALREALAGLDIIMGGVPLNREAVEIELQLNHASLLLIPWELLVQFVGPGADFVVLLKNAALFRSVPRYTGVSPRTLNVDAPVIFAWSDAGGGVPYEEHCRAIEASVGTKRLILVKDASLMRIREAYQAACAAGPSPTALHLLCHGAPVGANEYGLRLHGADGRLATIEALALKTALSTHLERISLLTLSACYGAEAKDWRSPMSSVAQAARGAGVDVIASQFPMSFGASVIVAQQLYRSLFVERQPLIIAHHRTVSVLYQDLSATLDWASLVLMKVN